MEAAMEGAGKYVRYTAEQLEAMERLYAECPKPTSMRRQQLIRECPTLTNIDPKQIKVWFQNRRCREKQRKESSQLQAVNRKLSSMNKLLMEENERLQKQVSQLVHENAYMRQQLHKPPVANDASCELLAATSQNSLRDANNPAGLLHIAEETLAEFLSKAMGTAVDWVQIPGMKPGPDSTGTIAVSYSCNGVAARACDIVNLEPAKIADILKDRSSWFRDCRSLEVFYMFPCGNGGTLELLYMQIYSPTTLAPARDLWTLRFTKNLEDGSLVVCERSLSGSGGGPNASTSDQFVRVHMLPSGFLIHPCEGGGSIVRIVDHLDLEPWSVPEVLRPLYESSRAVAQNMTMAALRHIRQVAQETNEEVVYAVGKQPAVLRTYSRRINRGFNDAINGFNDDGWSLMSCDGLQDVIVSTNSNKKINAHSDPSNVLTVSGGVICAKASMLLKNVQPALLIQFLREHRSEWADYSVDAYSAASLKAGSCSLPGLTPTKFLGSQIMMPLAHTIEHEEFLEVVRLEGQTPAEENAFFCRDVHLIQLCSGIDDNALGSCYQLVFAPIDEISPDDAPLLPSGFRVIPIDTKTMSGETSQKYNNSRSVVTIAFQFPYGDLTLESSITMARQYIRSIISAVQRFSMAITPSHPGSNVVQKLASGSPEAPTLAGWIFNSYSYHVGVELQRSDSDTDDSLLRLLWHHQDAILCCSLKTQPVFTFANQAGLDMLETTLVALQDITLDKVFDESGRKLLTTKFSMLMQQGYVHLPSGVCLSGTGRHVSYMQAVVWKVLAQDGSAFCLAFLFSNWSFV